MTLLLHYLVHATLITVLSPLFVGIIRACKARLQGRVGASVMQPYRDLRKLFGKNEVIPDGSSWVFLFSPYLIFATTLIVAASIPTVIVGTTGTLGNMFVLVFTLGLGTFFLALAGIDSTSSFGGFGSSREMSLAALAEGVLLFSLLPLAFIAHSQNLGDIAYYVRDLPLSELLPVLVASIAFVIALLTETGRIPVDNPATHLELTMIHEAMILEYSGKRLALVEWSSANKLLAFVMILCSVYFPWGSSLTGTTASTASAALAVLVLFAKLGVCAAGIALIESTMAKLRIFRVPRLHFTGLIIGAVALVLITA